MVWNAWREAPKTSSPAKTLGSTGSLCRCPGEKGFGLRHSHGRTHNQQHLKFHFQFAAQVKVPGVCPALQSSGPPRFPTLRSRRVNIWTG